MTRFEQSCPRGGARERPPGNGHPNGAQFGHPGATSPAGEAPCTGFGDTLLYDRALRAGPPLPSLASLRSRSSHGPAGYSSLSAPQKPGLSNTLSPGPMTSLRLSTSCGTPRWPLPACDSSHLS